MSKTSIKRSKSKSNRIYDELSEEKIPISPKSCSPLNPFITNHKGLKYIYNKNTNNNLVICDKEELKSTYCGDYDEVVLFKFILYFLENTKWLSDPIVKYDYVGEGTFGMGIKLTDKKGKKYMCKLLKCIKDNAYEYQMNEMNNNIMFNKYDSVYFNKFYLGMLFNSPYSLFPMLIYPKNNKTMVSEYSVKSINNLVSEREMNIGFIITESADGNLNELFRYENNRFVNLEIENFEEGLIFVLALILNILVGVSIIHNEGYGHYDLKEGNITYKKLEGKNKVNVQIIDLSDLVSLTNAERIRTISMSYSLYMPGITTPNTSNAVYKLQYDVVSISRIYLNLVLFLVNVFINKVEDEEIINNPSINFDYFLESKNIEMDEMDKATEGYEQVYEYIRDKLNDYNLSKLYKNLFRNTYQLLSRVSEEREKIENIYMKINIMCGIVNVMYSGYNDASKIDRNMQRLIKLYFSDVIRNIMDNEKLSDRFMFDSESNVLGLQKLINKMVTKKSTDKDSGYVKSLNGEYKYDLGKMRVLFSEEKLKRIIEKVKEKRCAKGMVVNPFNGKCESINNEVIRTLISDEIIIKKE